MSLVAPAFLAALALLVPVLIAFLVKRRRSVVRVPSTMVWRHLAKNVSKSRRLKNLRQLLALAACLAGVALLVVAAARPMGKGRDTYVFVVDVSASMDGPPMKDAKSWLKSEVARLGPDARVALVSAGSDARVLLGPTPPGPLVDRTIAALAATKETAAMEEALVLAQGLAGEREAMRVVVVSDHAIDTPQGSQRAPEMRVFPPSGEDNLGITSLYTRAAPDAHDDQERECFVSIATSSKTTRHAHLVLKLEKRVLLDRVIDVTSSEETVEHITLRGSGRLVATVTPADKKSDALAIDDEATLDESPRKAPRVVLVHAGESPAGYFVEQALRASGVKEITQINPVGERDEKAVKNADLVVVTADGPARPRGIPTFFLTGTPDGLGAKSITKDQAKLRWMETESPLLRGVGLDELTTLRARVADKLPPRAHSLVELDGGPVLVTGGSEKDSWVWLGIDPDGSDLVLRVAFPVLVGNVLSHLGGGSQVSLSKTAPRAEVALQNGEVAKPLTVTKDARWRFPVPISFAACFAIGGALLLLLELFITFGKRKHASA